MIVVDYATIFCKERLEYGIRQDTFQYPDSIMV